MVENLENEIWKDMIDYEKHYKISNYGRIWSVYKKCLMHQSISHKGYFYVTYCVNQKRKSIVTHRLVAKHFVENTHNKPQVNHKDGIKKNNHYLNLEWCTAKENTIHGIETGLINPHKLGEKNPFSKLTNSDVIEMRNLYENLIMSTQDIALKFNITYPHAWSVCNRKCWKHI